MKNPTHAIIAAISMLLIAVLLGNALTTSTMTGMTLLTTDTADQSATNASDDCDGTGSDSDGGSSSGNGMAGGDFDNNTDAQYVARALLFGENVDRHGLEFTTTMVAAMLGNFKQESGMTFNIVQYPNDAADYQSNEQARTLAASGPVGLGLAQWTHCGTEHVPDRACQLINTADAKHLTWHDGPAQMQMLIDELTPAGGCGDYNMTPNGNLYNCGGRAGMYPTLKQASSVEDAAQKWFSDFEGAGDTTGGVRITNAEDILPKLKALKSSDGSKTGQQVDDEIAAGQAQSDSAGGDSTNGGKTSSCSTGGASGTKAETNAKDDIEGVTYYDDKTTRPSQVVITQDEVSGQGSASGDSGNAYATGQCTWWAYELRKQLGISTPSYLGNGGQWYLTAPSHDIAVDHTPKVGAALSFLPGQDGADATYGHVAVVIKVNDDDSVVISEMNVKGNGVVNDRTIRNASTHWYVH